MQDVQALPFVVDLSGSVLSFSDQGVGAVLLQSCKRVQLRGPTTFIYSLAALHYTQAALDLKCPTEPILAWARPPPKPAVCALKSALPAARCTRFSHS